MAPIPAPHTTCPASTERPSLAGATANTFLCSAGHLDPSQNSPAAPGICSRDLLQESRGCSARTGKGETTASPERGTAQSHNQNEPNCTNTLLHIPISTKSPSCCSKCTLHTDPTWDELEGLEKHIRARAGFTPHRPSSDSRSQILCHTQRTKSTACAHPWVMGTGPAEGRRDGPKIGKIRRLRHLWAAQHPLGIAPIQLKLFQYPYSTV